MIRSFKVTCLLLLTASCLPAISQKLSRDSTRMIDMLLTEQKNEAPGGVLTITRHGKQIYSTSWGYADLEHDIKITPATIFEAGSVSKQFTATALLTLVEEGKIKLEDNVRTYLPDLPDYGTPITVRNLLVHTSGIKDWGSVAAVGGWPRGTRTYTQPLTREIIYRQKTLNFKPGTEYSYSNSGYALSVALVEKLTKKTLAEYTQEKIFGPVGMTNTQWRDEFRRVVKNRAIAYNLIDGNYLMDMPFEQTHGHGGLLTTTTDLLKWNQYWAEKKFGDKLASMREEQGKLTDGTTLDYAAGAVRIANINGYREVSHSGATAGYRAWLAYYPELDLSVAILSNDATSSVVPLGKKVIHVFTGKPSPPVKIPLSNEQLTSHAGLYRSETGYDLFEVKSDGSKLTAGGNTEYIPVAVDSFVAGGQAIVFTGDSRLGVRTSNGIRYYKRTTVFNPSAADLNAYTGAFLSKEADAPLKFKIINGRLTAWRPGAVGMALTPSYQDAFVTKSGMIIEFLRDAGKNITGCVACIDRAENVLFEKLPAE